MDDNDRSRMSRSVGVGMALGLLCGSILGVVTGNYGLWIGVGVALGVGASLAFGARR